MEMLVVLKIKKKIKNIDIKKLISIQKNELSLLKKTSRNKNNGFLGYLHAFSLYTQENLKKSNLVLVVFLALKFKGLLLLVT